MLDATMVVAGSMIGSGIFLVSAEMSRAVGSSGWLLVAWLLTGVITMIAALSYGELAGMMPEAGGQYVYIRRAFGRLPAFVYGWSVFTVIHTGVCAAVAVAFANYSAVVFPAVGKEAFSLFGQKFMGTHVVSVAMIVLLTYTNSRGIKTGKTIQLIFTSAKLLALLALIIVGIAIGLQMNVFEMNFSNMWKASETIQVGESKIWTTIPLEGFAVILALGTALVGSLFSADAWNSVTFISGEIKNPKKNIPLSLFYGTLIVTALYFLANIAYLGLLPLHGSPNGLTIESQGIQHALFDRVGTAAAFVMLGKSAVLVMAILIMISTFGCNNGLLMSGPRIYYAMAKDGLFIKGADKLNKHNVPANAMWMQGIWASVLCLSGSYGELLNYCTFASLLFYIITIGGLFKLRKTEPDTPRPYKAFGYPFVPALYIVIAALICIDLLWFKTVSTGLGLLIVLAGIPVYFMFKKEVKS